MAKFINPKTVKIEKTKEVIEKTFGEEKQPGPEIIVKLFATIDSQGTAKIKKSIKTSVAYHEKYGPGVWDRVPYTVTVDTGCEICCNQTEDEMALASKEATEFLLKLQEPEMIAASFAHRKTILEMYPELFKKN